MQARTDPSWLTCGLISGGLLMRATCLWSAKKMLGWFSQPLNGFGDWVEVSFVIVHTAPTLVKPKLVASPGQRPRIAVLAGLGIYAACVVLQICLGRPVETRVVALFAIGIPLLVALAAWWSWQPEVAAKQSATQGAA